MARTHGHGNARWSRDETILALNLYLICGRHPPGPSDDRVVRLSETLRELSFNDLVKRTETFRNPDGVAFKLQNIHNVATGEGLEHTSKVDRQVWAEFGADLKIIRDLANAILQGAEQLKAQPEGTTGDDDIEFREGRVLTGVHRQRERAPGLRRRLLVSRQQRSGLVCDMCDESSAAIDSSIADASFEVHHLVPLSLVVETKTRLSDLAFLCASCHRLLHRAIAERKEWIGIVEARKLVRRQKA